MRLRNRKTGEIIETQEIYENAIGKIRIRKIGKLSESYDYNYDSLAELNEEWEDYEEPKEYWYIDCYGMVLRSLNNGNEWDERRKKIGNYFEAREEAEKAVRKLKAFKRLKNKGFEFERVKEGVMGHEVKIYARFTNLREDEIDTAFFDNQEDLELLFRGEE